MEMQSVAGLIVATLGGAAIGFERQWSGHATGPHARFGGIRTFTLLGALAGLAGWLVEQGAVPLATVLLGAAAAVVVVGYAAASRSDIDATSEVAALVVLAAGTLAGSGQVTLASVFITGTALVLLEKTRLHALVHGIDDAALRASARFAAMACIVLPLLPSGPYGPYDAVRPRELWTMVLFFSGLSFVAWLLRRLVGPQQGTIVSGVLGGIISSTSVTLRFARDSRPAEAPRLALGAGAVGACTMLLVRVSVATLVLNPRLAAGIVPHLVPALGIGLVVIAAVWRRSTTAVPSAAANQSPLDLRSALQMAGLFQVVLFVILIAQARWGTGALVPTSMFVALTDLDALTLSLARSTAAMPGVQPAVVALCAGIVSNTLLKLVVSMAVGRGAYRVLTVVTLGAMAALITGSLLIG